VALVAESGADLQISLSNYCDKWSLCVNTKKSMVMVFGGGTLGFRCWAHIQRV